MPPVSKHTHVDITECPFCKDDCPWKSERQAWEGDDIPWTCDCGGTHLIHNSLLEMKIGTEEYYKMGAEALKKLTADPFVMNHCSECDKDFRDLIPEYICSTCRAQIKDDE